MMRLVEAIVIMVLLTVSGCHLELDVDRGHVDPKLFISPNPEGAAQTAKDIRGLKYGYLKVQEAKVECTNHLGVMRSHGVIDLELPQDLDLGLANLSDFVALPTAQYMEGVREGEPIKIQCAGKTYEATIYAHNGKWYDPPTFLVLTDVRPIASLEPAGKRPKGRDKRFQEAPARLPKVHPVAQHPLASPPKTKPILIRPSATFDPSPQVPVPTVTVGATFTRVDGKTFNETLDVCGGFHPDSFLATGQAEIPVANKCGHALQKGEKVEITHLGTHYIGRVELRKPGSNYLCLSGFRKASPQVQNPEGELNFRQTQLEQQLPARALAGKAE